MKSYIIQHVPFESPGILEKLDNFELIKVYESFTYPKIEDIDLLIVLGGPMNVHDTIDWLKEEKAFIRCVIESNKPILGICLGAQIIAEQIGGKVIQNPRGKEVGWRQILKTSAPVPFPFLPNTLEVLQWHGDTFILPSDATTFYSSDICKNQAFLYKNNIIGLQFHFETTIDSLKALADANEEYLDGGDFVQSKEAILSKKPPEENGPILLKLVDYLRNEA